MFNTGNYVADDDGRDCHSPYHDSNKCNTCRKESYLDSIRSDFRRDYEKTTELTYNDNEDQENALYDLESTYPELKIDMYKILQKKLSYLDF
jgi:hypothetical protein